MKLRVNGQDWRIARRRAPSDGHDLGSCDWPTKRIYVDEHLTGKRLVETVIHEVAHANLWCLSEEAVEELARTATRLLYKLKAIPRD